MANSSNLFVRLVPAGFIFPDLVQDISFLDGYQSDRYASVDFVNRLFLLNIDLKFW